MDFVDTTQVLGNLGESFGAIAVFATLAYVAVQIRQHKGPTISGLRFQH